MWRILNPAWSSGRRFGRARAGRQTKSRHIQKKKGKYGCVTVIPVIPVNFFIGAGDYALLADSAGTVIWSLKLKETMV